MRAKEAVLAAQAAQPMHTDERGLFEVLLGYYEVIGWCGTGQEAGISGWVMLGDAITYITLTGNWTYNGAPKLSHPGQASKLEDLTSASEITLILAEAVISLKRGPGATVVPSFFKIIGQSVSAFDGSREVVAWEQLAIEEIGDRCFLAVVKSAGEQRYLLQTKAEPGNACPGHVLVAPTLQASVPEHGGGSQTPVGSLIDTVPLWAVIPFDGDRFNLKVNLYGFVEVDFYKVNLQEGQFWATLDDVRDLYWEDMLNVHACVALLGALLGHSP